MPGVLELTKRIREPINGILRAVLLPTTVHHEQLFSSLDTIEDTEMAISTFRDGAFPEDTGTKYLWLHGVLQVMFVQQDAVRDLAACYGLQVKPKDDPGAQAVRDLRNGVTGHPTKQTQGVENGPRHNAIMRISLSRAGFKHKVVDQAGSSVTWVELGPHFDAQEAFVARHLESVLTHVRSLASEFAKLFTDTPMADLASWFPSYDEKDGANALRRQLLLIDEAGRARQLCPDPLDSYANDVRGVLPYNDGPAPKKAKPLLARYSEVLAELDESLNSIANGSAWSAPARGRA